MMKLSRTAVLRTIVALCVTTIDPTSAQFGEIASLVSGLIGSGALGGLGGLGNLGSLAGLAGSAGSAGAAAGAAGAGAAGALSSAGSLYQLAQTALQLTGTGVGILNQASEGAWFPTVVEQAAKNQREFQEKLLASNTNPSAIPLTSQGLFPSSSIKTSKGRELTVGPEFGTNFPAPDDYDDDDDDGESSTTKPTTMDIAESIDEKSVNLFPEEKETTPSSTTTTTTTTATTTTTTTEHTTADYEEETLTEAPRRRIRVEIPQGSKKDDNDDDSDYYDNFNTDKHTNTEFVFSGHIDEDEDPLLPPRATNPRPDSFSAPSTKTSKSRKTPDLSRLVEILKASNLEEAEVQDIINQVEGNKNGKPRENWPLTTTQNPEEVDPEQADKDAKRNRILEAHRKGIAAATRLPFRQVTSTLSPPVRHRKINSNLLHKNVTIVPRFVRPRTTAPKTRPTAINTTTISIESGRLPPKQSGLPDLRARAFSVNSQVNPKIHSTNAELKPLRTERYLVDSSGSIHKSSGRVTPQRTQTPPPRPTVVYPTYSTATPLYRGYAQQQNLGFYQQFPQPFPQLFYNTFSYPNPQPSSLQQPFAQVYTQPPQPQQQTSFQYGVPSLQPGR